MYALLSIKVCRPEDCLCTKPASDRRPSPPCPTSKQDPQSSHPASPSYQNPLTQPPHKYLPPSNFDPPRGNDVDSPPFPKFPPPPSPDYPSPATSGYEPPSSEYRPPSVTFPTSNSLPSILSTRESELLPPILSSKPFQRGALPPAPPSSSYLPSSPETPKDPIPTQCCRHLLITTRGQAFETQSSKTGEKIAAEHSITFLAIQGNTNWCQTRPLLCIASPLDRTTSFPGGTGGAAG